MRPHTRTHCSRKGEQGRCEGEIRCLTPRQSRASTVRGGGGDGRDEFRSLSLVELPVEILVKILEYITFKEYANVRLVNNILILLRNPISRTYNSYKV